MVLPPFSNDVTWKDYQINTPTFRLSPVEKPDMSPFLFHMTGRKEINSILDPGIDDFPESYGFIQSRKPESQSDDRTYEAEVVCFTESPSFCLDFFRYRSYKRWKNNQFYGIGFDKSYLSELGARPCIYADNRLKNDLIVLKNAINEIELGHPVLKERLPSLIDAAYPLLMPLLEHRANQGFMWEREWRYHNERDRGLVFPYSAIRIICCPEEEESELRKILGKNASEIEFLRSWRDFNEVTNFLKNRKRELHIPKKESYEDKKEFLSILEEQLANHENVFNQIESFRAFIETIESKEASTDEALQVLRDTIDSMTNQIQRLKETL